ncbi:Narbonolide/10-deoxymethynolide synthase PikA1, modules 1 and 2 [Mytilus coruscus]|uniref:Narbonolide/10-deoxymethynolide synthase PikA1, modules 1 and 2 n=1 Tax=Mytilus coruscus TaxID=42192 RepID=A0A6J8F1B3_MYTCO|nr:Narbonolide/10-deoxymethynolide synthase PikA1, modules 1 and 2 [Mytilus coruscus]
MDDDDAIAIIGIGCKFPGADNQEEFWQLLVNGENHVIDIPSERWNNDAFYNSDPNAVGKTYVPRAGFLKSHDEFDNKLFGINDLEAERMDPQQRYVLECVHMAMEDGGITRNMISGSDTGVFIGFMNDDYKASAGDDLTTMTNYTLTGTSPSIISARVSYVYNLLGPSMSIDSACSSALVAIDVAAQSLKMGRSTMAICGGVNSILSPELFIPLSRARMASPTGQCHAFSSNADGYARGEGCGIVILKKLGDAKKDSNKIWATIATDCNQDGHTATPITAPSACQQEKLLLRVYLSNNVNPNDVKVIEAHGTGTPVRDPIEVNTLGRFFGKKTNDQSLEKHVVYIASVKTNIGHLESAAGVAGLIKVLLMMKNETIVPSLNFEKPNEKIDFEKYHFIVPTHTIQWKPDANNQRIACGNCFGFGGTNSHVIVKQFQQEKRCQEKHLDMLHLVFLSAVDLDGLKISLVEMIEKIIRIDIRLCDVSYTSLCRRDHHQYRIALLANSLEDLKLKLRNQHNSNEPKSKVRLRAPSVVAVFCGVGTTWKAMCSQLLKEYTVVKRVVQQIDSILNQWVEWSIYDILANGKDISDPFTGHIAIFACQIALWSLWRHWGITVDSIIGQSVGEIAAVYAAGCLTLENAVALIYHRSKILSTVTGGKMFVIGNCNTKYIESVCSKFQGKACIAVYISSTSCTVSSDADIVDIFRRAVKDELPNAEKESFFLTELNVQCAYHSHHTKQAGNDLEKTVKQILSTDPSIPLISTVTGKTITDGNVIDASYWNKNVSCPVLFKDAVSTAGNKNTFKIFLEIGPKPVLQAHLRDSYSHDEAICLPSMRERHEEDTLLTSIAELFEHGVNLDWHRVCKEQGNLCDIPKYKFNPKRKSLFLPDVTLLKFKGLDANVGNHLFVSKSAISTANFKVKINDEVTPFVFEHYVSNTPIVPGAFYAEVALEVGQSHLQKRVQDICVEVEFIRPIFLSPGQSYTVDVSINDLSSKSPLCLLTKDTEVISKFTIRHIEERPEKENINIDCLFKICPKFQSSEDTYDKLNKMGFSYGKNLKILGESWNNGKQCLVKIHISDIIWGDVKMTHFHPAILDGLLQTPSVLFLDASDDRTVLPAGIGKLILRRGIERNMIAYTELKHRSKSEVLYNMLLLTVNGSIIAEIEDFRLKVIGDVMSNTSFEYALLWENIKVNHMPKHINPDKIKNRILLCSFDRDVLHQIREFVPDIEVKTLLLNEEASLSSQKDIFKSFWKENPGFVEIYFAPGKRMTDRISGTDVLKKINASCIALLAVVQCITGKKDESLLTVITEATQVPDITNCSFVNPFGSELWGQVRSIIREHISFKIRLIDCHPSISGAMKFISQLFIDDSIPKYGELIFYHGKVFTNHLQKIASDKPISKYRYGSIDDYCNVAIKTEIANDIKQTFCVLQNDPQEMSKNHISLSLDEVSLHSKCLYPVTLTCVSHDQTVFAFKGTHCSEYDLLSCESTATIHELNGLTPITKSNTGPNNDDKVVVCFPMRVQSTVEVPLTTVYPLQQLPGYKPGVIFASVLMHSLVHHVQKGHHAHILCDKENEFSGRILQLFLKMIKRSSARLHVDVDWNFDSLNTVLILKILSPKDIHKLVEIRSLSLVIALSPFLNQDDRIILQMYNVEVKVIQIDDVVSKENFVRVTPFIFKFWHEHNLDVEIFERENNENSQYGSNGTLQIPTKTMSMKFDNIQKYNFVKMPQDTLFRKDGCYIVIGGLTGLGWEIINFAADRGAGEIISLSRRNVSIQQQNELDMLCESTGCRIRAMVADITIWDDVQKVFFEIEQSSQCKIKGIFQGAGVLKDALTSRMNEDHLIDVLKPKVLGTWNLHLVSRKYPLDYFVMHSSMTSVMGNIGQSNYGAANAFMDCLAHYRRLNGLSGQSINWGPLDVGMLKDGENIEEILKQQGYFPLDVSDILKCLQKSLHSNLIQVTFGQFDWNLIGINLKAMKTDYVQHRFYDLYSQEKETFQVTSSKVANDELIEIIEATPYERKEKIAIVVFRTASEVFTLDIDILQNETLVQELGIDSMQSMSFVNTIYDITGVRIPAVTLMLDETSFENIIEILNSKISERSHSTPTKQPVDISIVNSITPMEKMSYDAYLLNSEDPSLFIYADLEVSGRLVNPDVLKYLFSQLQAKHSAIRTLFLPNQEGIRYGIRKHTMDPDKCTLDFIEVPMKALDHDNIVPSDIQPYLFDPSKELPLRIMFARNANKGLVRLVFNHLSFDLTSIMILIRSIPDIVQSKSSDGHPTLEKDVAVLYEQKFQSRKDELIRFWKHQTPAVLYPMSFKGSSRVDWNLKHFDFIKVTADKDIALALTKFMKKQNVKLFDIVVSLYQILLSAELKIKTVSLSGTVDMRIHFQDLKETVCQFINRVPFYANVDHTVNFSSFLGNNKRTIASAIENSLLPFDNIVEFLTKIKPEDVFRHQIIMESIQDLGEYQKITNDVTIKRICTGNYNETVLLVWHDLKKCQLDFELGYSTLILDDSRARNILNMLYQFVQYVIKHPDSTTGSLIKLTKKECLQTTCTTQMMKNKTPLSERKRAMDTRTKNDIDTRHVSYRSKSSLAIKDCDLHKVIGQFMKQTTRGWDHKVTISIKKENIGRTLNWGFLERKKTKSLSMDAIEKVETNETNGKYYVRIHANHRLYIFKTADPKLFEQFSYELTHTDFDFPGVLENDSLLF